jgi:RNA polymerase sigma factor (sigma-70 family)
VADRETGDDTGDAFALFFNAHAPRLLAFALRRTGSPSRAEDLLSGVMEVAWNRFSEIPPGAEFGWLCGVAVRLAWNERRARGRYDRMMDAAVAEAEVRPLATYLESNHLLEEQREAISDAFAVLDEDDQEILRLVAWEGLGGAQLAAALDVSEPAARKRLSRARDRLQRAYRGTQALVPAGEEEAT